jgi:hypothetical protein
VLVLWYRLEGDTIPLRQFALSAAIMLSLPLWACIHSWEMALSFLCTIARFDTVSSTLLYLLASIFAVISPFCLLFTMFAVPLYVLRKMRERAPQMSLVMPTLPASAHRFVGWFVYTMRALWLMEALWKASHILICGMTGAYKTITMIIVYLQAVKVRDEFVIVIDCKGDDALCGFAKKGSAESGKPFSFLPRKRSWIP